MKVLVTGIHGFIGSRLASRLCRAGLRVEGHGRGDSIPAGPCDAVIHCAGAAPSPGTRLPAAVLARDNIELSGRIAAVAAERFIVLSTTAVYGPANGSALTEEAPVNCSEPYAMSKYLSERLFAEKAKNAAVLRLPVICGGTDRRFFVSRLIEAVARGEKTALRGLDGPFNILYHVDHLAELVAQLLRPVWSGHHLFNVSCGEPLTLREIVGLIAGHFGRPVPIEDLGPAATPNWVSHERILRFLALSSLPTVAETVTASLRDFDLAEGGR
jgi:nucleoside-diphosphate-sugar epimerase